jgi:hypothetical protein
MKIVKYDQNEGQEVAVHTTQFYFEHHMIQDVIKAQQVR